MTKRYGVAFFLSLMFHVALLVGFVYSLTNMMIVNPQTQSNQIDVVKAITIDQKAVNKQIQQIKAHEKVQHLQQARVRQLYQKLDKQNKQAELQLARLKASEKQLQTKNRAAQRKIHEEHEKAKQEQKKAQQELSALKQQKNQQQKLLQQLRKQTNHVREQQQNAEKRLTHMKKNIENMKQKARQDRDEKLLQQQLAAEQALLTQERNRRIQNQLQKYTLLIYQAIASNWNIPTGVDPSLVCEFAIHLASDGRVISVKLIHGSGDAILDRSATTAIYRASPLPVPKDPALFKHFSVFNVKVKPEGFINEG